MKIYVLVFLFHCSLAQVYSGSDLHIGYQVTLAIPSEYSKGFVGRAFLMGTEKLAPNFRTSISVEAVDEKYTCSLDIFLGDVKVWNSGHLSRFYTTEKCVLEFTQDGDLRLKGQKDRVGWRSGTSGQGVKRLHLLRSGNLVLVDDLNLIKWQTFNFPTDIMLWGQRLSSATRLTSFPDNSSLFYSFEIEHDKIALYLNLGKWKYSYWEYRPPNNPNITFVELTSNGLDIYTGFQTKIDEILSTGDDPVMFLALDNSTGSFGLYHYSAKKQKFEASYQAINSTCDLPLTCKPYGICTSTGSCSCIRLGGASQSDCHAGNFDGLCGKSQAEMIELQGVASVLKSSTNKTSVTKRECGNMCLDDCTCVAAQYNKEECDLYEIVRGIKQVEPRSDRVYMVKVPKGTGHGHAKNSGLKKWVIIVIGVADGFVILLVLGGVGYYVIRKRKQNSSGEDT